MDPLSGIGLASSIITFIDFGCGLFNDAQQIYRSANGLNQGLEEIDVACERSKKLAESIESRVGTTDDYDLNHMAESCLATANEITKALNEMRLASDGKRASKRMSFRKALTQYSGSKKVEDLYKRLQTYKTDVSQYLTFMTSDQQSTVLNELRLLQKTCEAWQLNQQARLDSIFSSVKTVNQMAETFLNNAEDLTKVSALLPQIGEDSDKIRREQEIITSLNYRPRKYRYDAIEDAHTQTFEWVYRPPHDQLLQWLKCDSGIFWLSGKPGAGKSTLMKFIVDDYRTSEALAFWAREKECVMAEHFFWISGATIQMSQEGLFRSLLYKILKERPRLVETLCPSLWNEPKKIEASEREFDQIWSRRSLRDAISRLEDCQDTEVLFCFFIDGLDEYQGDHLEMVRTLESLVVSGSIKICVSSRPWNVFSNAFGQIPGRKVLLQDLTHNDLVAYVQDKLGEHHLWRELTTEVQEQIVEEILQKAEGVFLWVYLVVKQLREGLSNGDTVEVLQQRVRTFPPDLEEFFSRMMTSIDPLYLSHSARAFQVALHAPKPLPTLLYSFLDDEAENEQYSVRLAMQPFDQATLKRRIKQVPRRLQARCKGLLEVVTSDNALYGEKCLKSRVEFMHRTARDFIATRQMTDFLSESAKDFQPYTSILRAYLAMLKVLKTQPRRGTMDTARDENLRDLLQDAFSYANAAEEQQKPVDYTVLDEFATTINHIRMLEGGILPCLDQLVTGVPGASQQMSHDPGPDPNPFHIVILKSGLTKYFTQLEGLQYTTCGASLLLVCIVHLHCQHPELQINIRGAVLAILDKGVDFNQTLVGQSTTWAFILSALATARTRTDHDDDASFELEHQFTKDQILRQNLSTITVLLERGADPNVHTGDGYPMWLDILNSNMLCAKRRIEDEDAIFRVLKAFVGAGACVNSSFALQMWDRLLDMLLRPKSSGITDMQITNLLVLAIESGADLDPMQIKILEGCSSPHVFLKINTAWTRRCESTSLTQPPQAIKQRPGISKHFGTQIRKEEWCYSLLISLFSISFLLYCGMLNICHRASRHISRFIEPMLGRAVLYVLRMGVGLVRLLLRR